MIPATQLREVKSEGVQAKGVFAISMTHQAHIMTILRDTLYSDKELAILREYSSNAWDAHREAGKGDLPIKVHVPTEIEPVLTIRDFGHGLSEHDVFNVFTKYGESTKRDTDEAVGMLGIGCKSGFCYSESFTVTSWHGGMKSVYVAFLDPSDKGEINKIASVPCDPSETGLEITIAVKTQDVSTFERKAINLFRYFEPRPEINVDLPEESRSVTKHGFINKSGMRDWIALMGCVPYRVDLQQIHAELVELGLWDTLYQVSGGLYFDIGDVQVSASREELKYSDKTKKAILDKLPALLNAYVEDTLLSLKSGGATGWQKRSKVLFLSGTLGLAIPKAYQEYTRHKVPLYGEEKPKTFILRNSDTGISMIPASTLQTVYFYDTEKAVKGYYTSRGAIILCPINNARREEVLAEFEALCLAADIDGLPVENISTCSWYPPSGSKAKRPSNRKHYIRSFQIRDPDVRYHSPWSGTWEIVKREPTDDDLFVVIKDFKAVGWDDFHSAYRRDRQLAAKLGVEIPPVYGYKTTAKKPIERTDCKGTFYGSWRKSFFQGLLTPEYREIARVQGWAGLPSSEDMPYSYKLNRNAEMGRIHEVLGEALGPTHPCTLVFEGMIEGREALREVSNADVDLVNELMKVCGKNAVPSEAQQALAALFEKYPLLKMGGLAAFAERDKDLWVDYVKLVDRDAAAGPRLSLVPDEKVG